MIVSLYVIRTLQTVIVCCCCLLLLNINAQSYEFLTMAMDNGKNSRNSVKVKMKTLIRLQSWRQCDNLSGKTLKILTINLKIRIHPPENLIFDRECSTLVSNNVTHFISELSHRLLFLSHKNTICHKYCYIIGFIGSWTMGIRMCDRDVTRNSHYLFFMLQPFLEGK